MTGYSFHSEAVFDLDGTWEFIRADNLDAADRMIAEILETIEGWCPLHIAANLLRCLCASFSCLIVYAPEERPWWVVAVIQGRRSPRLTAGSSKTESDSTRPFLALQEEDRLQSTRIPKTPQCLCRFWEGLGQAPLPGESQRIYGISSNSQCDVGSERTDMFNGDGIPVRVIQRDCNQE